MPTDSTILTSHDTCTKVYIWASEITVLKPLNQFHGHYAFTCPKCRQQVVKEADERVVDMLLSNTTVKLLETHYNPENPNPLSPLITEEEINTFISSAPFD